MPGHTFTATLWPPSRSSARTTLAVAPTPIASPQPKSATVHGAGVILDKKQEKEKEKKKKTGKH